MADKKVDVIFSFVDKFSKQFKSTMGLLESGTKASQRAWKNVQQSGAAIAGVGKALTASVTLPLVGIGAVVTKEFGEVDKSMRLVQATMGADKWGTADLTGAIKEAASNSVFGMKDAAEASLNFARQGWDAAQSANMLTPSLDLAAATATDLSVVTGGLGNTLKAFGASAAEAAHYSDMMAVAQAQANTDVTSLFDAMSIAGSTAKTVGWGFEDLATLTGVFGDHSISASEGATALNTGLMRLASPAKQGSEMMKKLGINVFDSAGKLKQMPEVMGELQGAFSGLNDQEKLAAASAIFGKQQASKWITLLSGPGQQELDKLRGNIRGASGDAHTMADALLSGVGGAIERLKSSFDVFKYNVGSAIGPVIQPFIEQITELMNRFNHLSSAQQQNIVKWAAMAAAVGPAIMVFGKAVSIVGSVGMTFAKLKGFVLGATAAVKEATAATRGVHVVIAMLTSPLGIVMAAVAAVGAVVVIVAKNWDYFKEKIKVVYPHIEKIIEYAKLIRQKLNPVITVVQKIGSVVGSVIGKAVVNTVVVVANTVVGTVELLLGAINKLLDVIRAIKRAAEAAGKALKEAFKDVKVPEFSFRGLAGSNDLPHNAGGTLSWRGGPTWIHERGGEIIDLPHGTRIYPHDVSMQMAKNSGGGGVSIAKLADQIIVREDADIDKIGDAIVRKLRTAAQGTGGFSFSGNMA
ncbi:MAG: phage tail tape measure protein [[Clostridium] aminophilum]|uniref:phage tail tape measure protein n=1 Tax=[Clostridium] aminophilum TaxID=1526 RepID=UPI0026ED1E75|nr:phage tail tape measure protein [[Clostridium] aminophilum]MDD6196876.1 phage tail tape measure protein [[Clostridium] aminophilum]